LIFILALASFDITILFYFIITNLVLNSQYQFIQISRCLSVARRQNEGSFGCEAVARAVGQPNVPECAVGFHFLCLYAAKILFSFYRLFCLFTMNANGSLRKNPY